MNTRNTVFLSAYSLNTILRTVQEMINSQKAIQQNLYMALDS